MAHPRRSSPPSNGVISIRGNDYSWQKQRRGTPAVRNSAGRFHQLTSRITIRSQIPGWDLRVHLLTSPGRYRAMTALMLLAPGTPMLFQGEEFASSSPFVFFADHRPKLASAVSEGRADFFSTVPQHGDARNAADHPGSRESRNVRAMQARFQASVSVMPTCYALHCDLLRLRKEDAAFSGQRAGTSGRRGARIRRHSCFAFSMKQRRPASARESRTRLASGCRS